MAWSPRRLVLAALLLLAGGCEQVLETQATGDLPVAITAQVSQAGPDQVVTISATVRNLSGGDLSLRMQCSVLSVDFDNAGTWVRYEDLRLCAPPDRMTLGAGATINANDQRLLSPGRYRVAVESVDGKSAVSEPFSISGQ